MAPITTTTAALLIRQFGDVGGAITGAANTAANAVTGAAETAGGAVGTAAGTVAGAVNTAAGVVGGAAGDINQASSAMQQLQQLEADWRKYHQDVYIGAAVILGLIVLGILFCLWSCIHGCYDCCCRDENHSHHDHKAACCGLCGGAVVDGDKKKIIPPERSDCCGMKVDKAKIARGSRARYEDEDGVREEWVFCGRLGIEGSWFNRQREKDGWHRWLGGRDKFEGWPAGEEEKYKLEHGIPLIAEKNPRGRDPDEVIR